MQRVQVTEDTETSPDNNESAVSLVVQSRYVGFCISFLFILKSPKHYMIIDISSCLDS